ncbi:MAG: hypothetical protein UT13_C0001G0414 [Candidatus Pacebacteria bacterium GW2011_GWF2_38_9]|nr:MAG: hypothetical protein US01_C0001G0425 [candidate division TM6 bacterium GW2011_GWF2_28_16]KKQ08527.1 MAG: hypothetical protein US20_C0015G0015 [Candidatus Pacebacteria bacterium GW2011_GWF1_36_5]KKQ88767.1 MAG: hypothetical protein UT13_C0001G0414 [Candidatus Pacebacteria bacterium GW2011_GWF2_38_9]HAZ73293.1 hypothetical protein [Candidatus Paceibacterota bacterium]
MSTSNSGSSGPNLTNINYAGRLLVKYGIAFLIFLMVGRVLLNAFVNYWKATHPDPPPAPTVGFGTLPNPAFPVQTEEDKPQSYSLEMVYGVQEITDRSKVFLVTKSVASLLSDSQIKSMAANYGFIFTPEIIDGKIYRFTKNTPLDMSLEISSVDFTFEMKSNFLSRPDLLSNESKLPEEFEAVARVKKFIESADLMGSDVATASGQVTFLKSIGGELKTAFSLSEADFLQVDINRNPIDQLYNVYTDEGKKGIISAKLSSAFTSNNSIVEMDYHYRQVDYLNFETYPLRTAKSAWNLVQAGDAYVINGKGIKDVIVRELELAYYDSFDEQKYLQPIYVFKGDNDFMAFVPAVSANYLNRSQTE